jgi:hypothetical protein
MNIIVKRDPARGQYSLENISPLMMRFFLSSIVNDSRQIQERFKILAEQCNQENDKFTLSLIRKNLEELLLIQSELKHTVIEITKIIR